MIDFIDHAFVLEPGEVVHLLQMIGVDIIAFLVDQSDPDIRQQMGR